MTPGEKSAELLEQQWRSLALPPLAGKTVLDLGAWDGYFSFRAEAEGAARVVALDSFAWALDFSHAGDYWREAADADARGLPRPDWGPGGRYWDLEALPGRRSFDYARRRAPQRASRRSSPTSSTRSSSAASTSSSSSACSITCASRCAGSSACSLTGELAVIESAAIDVASDAPLIEFAERDEINGDPSVWFVPTERALLGLCRAAGFRTVDGVNRTEPQPAARGGVADYRLTVHARP